jgi:UDP-N-acetylmuramyl-tripeptide synthetase
MGRYCKFNAMHGTGEKYLAPLLLGTGYRTTSDISAIRITGLAVDSRQVEPGHLFIAAVGLAVDGHNYIPEAVARGCAAVLFEKGRLPAGRQPAVPAIEVDDTREALGRVAANYYGHPAREMRMIGITGTNGKTTTAYLVEAIIKAAGQPGVIGTVNYRYQSQDHKEIRMEAPLTTPEPIFLHRLLRQMADNGVSHVVMEVSSHALVQKRLASIFFDIAVFTNLSRDHLDFHGDMETYFAGKQILFCEHLKPGGTAVIVLDSPTSADGRSGTPTAGWGQRLQAVLAPRRAPAAQMKGDRAKGGKEGAIKVLTCSLAEPADIFPRSYTYNLDGIDAQVMTPQGGFHLRSPLVGDFNLKNLLAAVGAGMGLHLDPQRIQAALAGVTGIPGRLERIPTRRGGYIFVDYAHTPDALENVLITLRKLKPSRLVCVFGCGGDRDAGKRPLMGKAAGALCDVVLITSDNPRTEDPQKIIYDIEQGLLASPLYRVSADILVSQRDRQGYDIIISRREAIRTAVRDIGPGEVVLIAGKGHECYQITSTGKNPFDDRFEARKHADGGNLC